MIYHYFFSELEKLAIGLDTRSAMAAKELQKKKPEPFKLPTSQHTGRLKVKGLKMPRIAVPRPKLQATKGTAPLSLRSKFKPPSP